MYLNRICYHKLYKIKLLERKISIEDNGRTLYRQDKLGCQTYIFEGEDKDTITKYIDELLCREPMGNIKIWNEL